MNRQIASALSLVVFASVSWGQDYKKPCVTRVEFVGEKDGVFTWKATLDAKKVYGDQAKPAVEYVARASYGYFFRNETSVIEGNTVTVSIPSRDRLKNTQKLLLMEYVDSPDKHVVRYRVKYDRYHENNDIFLPNGIMLLDAACREHTLVVFDGVGADYEVVKEEKADSRLITITYYRGPYPERKPFTYRK